VADIYVTCTGNSEVITVDHLKKMKDQGDRWQHRPFSTNEIQVDLLNQSARSQELNIKAAGGQVHLPGGNSIYLLAERRLVQLGMRPPDIRAFCHVQFRFSNQVLAQLDLWKNKDTYKPAVYRLPKILDEEVARLHLERSV